MEEQALKDKAVWITGATGAIGRAVAVAFAKAGADLILSARQPASLQGLVDELVAAGAKATVHALDVTDRNAVDKAAAAIVAAKRRIDILVNSTTNPIFGDFLALSDEDWEKVLQAKFFGYLRTMRAVLPHMVRGGGGQIINISGRGGHQPSSPAHLPGSSANAAVNLLTKGLANIYGRHGIRINAVAPGPIASPRYDMIAQANAAIAARDGAPARSGAPSRAAFKEIGAPEDVAEIVLFLASDRSRHLTGVILQADGGGTASL